MDSGAAIIEDLRGQVAKLPALVKKQATTSEVGKVKSGRTRASRVIGKPGVQTPGPRWRQHSTPHDAGIAERWH